MAYTLIQNNDSGSSVRTTLNSLLSDVNNGVVGSAGTSGTNGSSGTSGAAGLSGSSGTSGSSGINGSNGSNGSSGTSGAAGSSGSSGANGSSGTSGSSGANGSSGTSGTTPSTTGLLTLGESLDTTLKLIKDFSNTNSALRISTQRVGIGTGTLTQNGVLTIKSNGENLLSFRDAANNEVAYIQDGGNFAAPGSYHTAAGFIATQLIKLDAGVRFKCTTDGILLLHNDSSNNFDRIQIGGSTASAPAIRKNAENIEFILADNTGFTGVQGLYNRFGTGSPEGVVTAPVGAIYSRTDGGTGTTLYVKESGTGNTGWVAK